MLLWTEGDGSPANQSTATSAAPGPLPPLLPSLLAIISAPPPCEGGTPLKVSPPSVE
jgi:hypothetical protein